jgi:hypothetical protein
MLKDYRKDLEDFISGSEIPPENLKLKVQKDMLLTLNRNSIIAKFLIFQLLGALITLSFCPQFGIGFVEGHGIAHVFRMMGDWACAGFCGSLFLSAGTILASFGMKADELYWIWDHYRIRLILLPALIWSALMLMNLGLKLPSENLTYNLVWVISAMLAQQLFLKLRNVSYTGVLRKAEAFNRHSN